MSAELSVLEGIEELSLNRLLYERLSLKEKLELEEKLSSSIRQDESEIEGYTTRIERDEEIGIVIGSGMMDLGGWKAICPYVGVKYYPKLFEGKDAEKIKEILVLMDDYLTKKANKRYPYVIPISLGIIRDTRIANSLGEKIDWVEQRITYAFNDMLINLSITNNGFMFQAYFTVDNRKEGFKTLIEASKEFEKYIGLK